MPSKGDKFTYSLAGLAGGIKRDGTTLDGNFFSDGLWCRFRNGRPKKIGGYREIVNLSTVTVPAHGPTTPIRGIFPYASSPLYLLYAMHGNGVTGVSIDQNGVGASAFDRTPAGFTAADKYTWSNDALYDNTGGVNQTRLITHAAPDLVDIADDTAAPIYYGTASDQAAALTSTGISVSGGCVVLQPFLFYYGSNGLIGNTDANKPTTTSGGLSNIANVAGTKIVKGMPLRGGAASPAGLFWGLDCLIRVSFIGGTVLWRYDTISEETSILSKNSVIEYDGIFYWAAVDRFLLYDGVIKEVANPLNQDFFFDNLNWTYRQKVWATKVPRYGEIWWFFPKGNSTECNWAVVYNVREKTWYDTPINRSAGYQARQLYFPVWADSASNAASGATGYRLFRHEFGVDSIVGEQQSAIQSYFETSDIGFASGLVGADVPENQNVTTRLTKVEPDIRQTGQMTMTVRGKPYASDVVTDSQAYPVPPPNTAAGTGKVDPREQRRLLSLKFESNVLGGNYHSGKTLVHLEPGDGRP